MTRNVISITKLTVLLLAGGLAAACEATKSETPTSPNVSGPIAGVGITAPAVRSPIQGTEVVNTEPLRLVFGNSSTNGVRPLYYFVEMAADRDFNQRVYMNPKVLPLEGEQTSVVVDARLDAEKTYYWRVRAEDGANSSDFSAVAQFDLVVPVVIGAPTTISPSGGESVSTRTPQLRINNGSVQGRTGNVWYEFRVATDQAFGNVVFSGSTARDSGGVTSITTSELPAGSTLFWRAYGTNGTISSAHSSTQSFRTAAPAPPPSGGGGGGGTPPNWSTDQWRAWFFDLVARKGYPNATHDAMAALRGDLLALGADWQNGWRGDYRTRIYLPTGNCPPPTSANVPECSYGKAVDVGENGVGRPWTWVPRF